MSYYIRMRPHFWGWSARVEGCSEGDFTNPPLWWRPDYGWAFECATRWCSRHFAKNADPNSVVMFDPHDSRPGQPS